jgi:Ner family transcriptional regulator
LLTDVYMIIIEFTFAAFMTIHNLGFPKMTNSVIKWDRYAIAAEIRRRGTTLTQLALDHGLGSSSCRSALCRATPRGDHVISTFLAVPLHELWPDRYDASGNRLRSGCKANSIRGLRKSRRLAPTMSSTARVPQDPVVEVA